MKNLKFLGFGILFGIILYKGEVISWFRIQEMFRFGSFHMYGTIGGALVVGVISVFLIKKYNIKTINGEPINLESKPEKNIAGIVGGILFGLGWALTGACPGPIFTLLGSGLLAYGIVLLFAILGVFVYGILRDKLPH
jgi:hypothetical protein